MSLRKASFLIENKNDGYVNKLNIYIYYDRFVNAIPVNNTFKYSANDFSSILYSNKKLLGVSVNNYLFYILYILYKVYLGDPK